MARTFIPGLRRPQGRTSDDMTSRRSPLITKLSRALGPGLLTGAADDDPSGIATYSQSGAQLGYTLCWTMFLTTPFMVAIQIVSARIGSVTGRGLAANLGAVLPRPLLFAIIALLTAANVVNIAADIAAMAAAMQLLVGGPGPLYALCFGIICLSAQIAIPYRPYARYMKFLTLVLFAYVATALVVHVPWNEVLLATLVPHLPWNRDAILMLVAVLGTTISPYLFFWQASLEVEERRIKERRKAAPLKNDNASARRRFGPIVVDTWIGMVLSNVIGFFIIVATAATLHAHGTTTIDTAASAAEALRPLAGGLAFLVFPFGILGTGLLAMSALAGSAAYAVAEAFGWKNSLGLAPWRAQGFYVIIAAATLIGSFGAAPPINSIRVVGWGGGVHWLG